MHQEMSMIDQTSSISLSSSVASLLHSLLARILHNLWMTAAII